MAFELLIINDLDQSFFEVLETEKYHIKVDYLPGISPSEVPLIIEKYDGLIVRSKMKINKELIDKAANLKFIARAGAGVDNIDEEYANSKGIPVLNAPEGNRDAVAEHIIGMLLMLFNKLNLGNMEVNQKVWNREGNRGLEIKGKTIGLIGFGNNGSATAQKLANFGCNILAYDKYKSGFGNESITECGLAEIFENADVLSLHVPLTMETKFLANEEFFNSFRKPIFFINAARGKITSITDLKKALLSGKVLGACLDVLQNEDLDNMNPEEELAFNYMVSNPKVLFTPHVAGWTKESYIRISEVLAQKVNNLLGKSQAEPA